MPASRQAVQKPTGPAARAVTQKLGADEYFSGPADVQRMLKSRSALASPRSRTDHPRMWRLEGCKKNIAGESSHQILPARRQRRGAFSSPTNRTQARRRGEKARQRCEERARARVGSVIRRGDHRKQTPESEEAKKIKGNKEESVEAIRETGEKAAGRQMAGRETHSKVVQSRETGRWEWMSDVY